MASGTGIAGSQPLEFAIDSSLLFDGFRSRRLVACLDHLPALVEECLERLLFGSRKRRMDIYGALKLSACLFATPESGECDGNVRSDVKARFSRWRRDPGRIVKYRQRFLEMSALALRNTEVQAADPA